MFQQGNFEKDDLFPLSQMPLPAQFDVLLEEQTSVKENFHKLQTLYQLVIEKKLIVFSK